MAWRYDAKCFGPSRRRMSRGRRWDRAALPYLIALARRCNSHVFITHVVPSALPAFFRGGQRLRSAGAPASVNFASDHLSGISHEFLMRDGEVAPTLCRLARGYDVDLIVIRMRRRMATAALGSLLRIRSLRPCFWRRAGGNFNDGEYF